MSAFLIVNYDIDDPELYAEYQGGAVPALRVGTDCEVVVFDTDSQHVEGEHTGRTTVVLKFESMEKARETRASTRRWSASATPPARTTSRYWSTRSPEALPAGTMALRALSGRSRSRSA
jgi:uncharacterized protein (DUF1330 family)